MQHRSRDCAVAKAAFGYSATANYPCVLGKGSRREASIKRLRHRKEWRSVMGILKVAPKSAEALGQLVTSGDWNGAVEIAKAIAIDCPDDATTEDRVCDQFNSVWGNEADKKSRSYGPELGPKRSRLSRRQGLLLFCPSYNLRLTRRKRSRQKLCLWSWQSQQRQIMAGQRKEQGQSRSLRSKACAPHGIRSACRYGCAV